MDSRRKVTLAILFVMTVLLAGASVFITIRIQQNNAATDANASGFGSTATTNKFSSVFEEFAKYPCSNILDTNRLSTESGLLITKIDSIVNNLDFSGAIPYLPLNCTYKLASSKSIDFRLYSYDTQSYIDPSAEALYARINVNIKSQLDSQTITVSGSSIKMFYGTDNVTTGACRANLYDAQNDFEYAEVIYKGFSDCSALIKDNKAITKSISGVINDGMTRVNKKF
ncbi:MAG: hypothetical protein ABI721_02850 [Candidatus Dojkabacteria bacterium]